MLFLSKFKTVRSESRRFIDKREVTNKTKNGCVFTYLWRQVQTLKKRNRSLLPVWKGGTCEEGRIQRETVSEMIHDHNWLDRVRSETWGRNSQFLLSKGGNGSKDVYKRKKVYGMKDVWNRSPNWSKAKTLRREAYWNWNLQYGTTKWRYLIRTVLCFTDRISWTDFS